MEGSEERGELFGALAKAQGEFKPVEKSVTNTFFKTKYADLASVVSMAAPILAKNGLAVVQTPEWDEAYADTVLTTTVTHSSGQWMSSRMRLFNTKHDPQNQGSAITYGRRYAYCAMLSIVADDDDDGNAAQKATQASNGHVNGNAQKKPQPAAPPPGQIPAGKAKQALIAHFMDQGIGQEAAKGCAAQAWGERGHAPISEADFEALLAELRTAGAPFEGEAANA